jgi:hypothetical protein
VSAGHQLLSGLPLQVDAFAQLALLRRFQIHICGLGRAAGVGQRVGQIAPPPVGGRRRRSEGQCSPIEVHRPLERQRLVRSRRRPRALGRRPRIVAGAEIVIEQVLGIIETRGHQRLRDGAMDTPGRA